MQSSFGDALVFQAGDCHSNADLGVIHASRQIVRGEGLLGRAWLTGVPIIGDDLAGDAEITGATAQDAAIGSAVVLPVLRAGQMTAAVAWFL